MKVVSAFLVLFSLCSLSAGLEAATHSKVIEYREGNTTLAGILAWDDARTGKRPAILLIHDWMGVGPYVQRRANMLASMGYVVLAADIYGKGVRPKTGDEARKTSTIYKENRPLMRHRAEAGLRALAEQPNVDRNRIVVMGYCFGGTVALELARDGADLRGVVSFHGGLSTPNPEDASNIKGRVLILHGGDDPYVTPGEVVSFQDEMRKARVDWQMVIYGGAVHAFTIKEAGDDASKGAAYNEKADRRSWEEMSHFLHELGLDR